MGRSIGKATGECNSTASAHPLPVGTDRQSADMGKGECHRSTVLPCLLVACLSVWLVWRLSRGLAKRDVAHQYQYNTGPQMTRQLRVDICNFCRAQGLLLKCCSAGSTAEQCCLQSRCIFFIRGNLSLRSLTKCFSTAVPPYCTNSCCHSFCRSMKPQISTIQGDILAGNQHLTDAAIPVQASHLTLFVLTLSEKDGSLQVN